MNCEPENGGRMRKNTTETRRWNSLSWFDAIPLWRLHCTEDSLDGLHPFQIFDRLVRSDDNGVARCTTAEQDNCSSAAVGGKPTKNCRQCKVAPNVRLLAKTNLVLHSPFELEVHWYSESKDSDIYDGPLARQELANGGDLGRVISGSFWSLSCESFL